ncbi:MAG: hypothetical protein ACPG5B_17585 [Chitinophagales bacterium]
MFEVNPFRIRETTGKNEKIIDDEEDERLEIARVALNDYGKYYNENKIFFNKETSALIETIANKFRQYYKKIITVNNMSSLSLSGYLNQQLTEINVETSKLINQLENKFRNILEE